MGWKIGLINAVLSGGFFVFLEFLIMKHLRDLNPCGFIGRCFYSAFNLLEGFHFWTSLEIWTNF